MAVKPPSGPSGKGNSPATTPKVSATGADIATQKKNLGLSIDKITRDLAKDMSGDDVLILQKCLQILGYLKVTPDGNFGPATEAALVQFKLANRLATDPNKETTKRFGGNSKMKMRELMIGAPQAVTSGVRAAVAATVRPQSKAAQSAPVDVKREAARLAVPPPEWKEKNPAAYRLYQKVAGEIASGHPFPRSENSQTTASWLLYGNREDRFKEEYEKKCSPYDELAHAFKKEMCDSRSGAYWRVHLNVEPEDVIAVSVYLRKQGYRHDYLQGSPEQTFSVYFGSKDMTDRGVKTLEKDIGKYLKKPRYANGQYTLAQELGTNISGEFRVHRSALPEKGYKESDIPGYGFGGLPVIGPYEKRNCNPRFYRSPEDQKKFLALRDVRTAFRELTQLFGPYFHGTK